MKYSILLVISLLFISCKNDNKELPKEFNETSTLSLKYAKGFSVVNHEGYQVLTISKPWPNASKTYNYLIASKSQLSKMTFPKDAYDGVINDSVASIVVTSTTHIPALELLGVEEKLIGFPETDYISSETVRQRIKAGEVRDLGKNESINTEVLLELNPDFVVGFGVDGVNKTFETIKKGGIPVIYNGDWVEASPLAKAEWIKFFGALFNKSREADSIFNAIENNYLEAKKIAKNVVKKPSVLSGAMHKEVWYLPNGNSPEAQLMEDANVDYLWKDTKGNGSLALSFEAVFDKGKNADFWLSPSYYKSFEQLKEANALYMKFKPFQTKDIYTFTNTTGATGGVLYYELGTARPDLVLKDLVKICHPDLNLDHELVFFDTLK